MTKLNSLLHEYKIVYTQNAIDFIDILLKHIEAGLNLEDLKEVLRVTKEFDLKRLEELKNETT